MKLTKYCKLLTILITFPISIIYAFFTSERFALEYNTTFPLTIFAIITTITFNLKNKYHLKKSFFYINTIFIILVITHSLQIILNYITFKYLNLDTDWYFLTTLTITLIETLFTLKKALNPTNDILTTIVCLLITLIQYRYYIDPYFVHNLIKLDSNNTIYQNSFLYVEQYYLSFTIILSILNLNNFISKISKNSPINKTI